MGELMLATFLQLHNVPARALEKWYGNQFKWYKTCYHIDETHADCSMVTYLIRWMGEKWDGIRVCWHPCSHALYLHISFDCLEREEKGESYMS